MFGLGTWEVMLILILALIVLGPSRLPGIAKSLGRGYNEFKRASQELRDSLTQDVDISDFRDSIDDAKRSLEMDIAFPKEPILEDLEPSDFNDAAETEEEEGHDTTQAEVGGERDQAESIPSGIEQNPIETETPENREETSSDPPAASGEGEDAGRGS
jgi:sec-independent protein translocase protein TatB